MKRRSFFGVVWIPFGALLALQLPRRSKAWGASGQILSWRYWRPYKPPVPSDGDFGFFPLEGGSYKPGEPFKITGDRMSVPITDEYFQSEK